MQVREYHFLGERIEWDFLNTVFDFIDYSSVPNCFLQTLETSG